MNDQSNLLTLPVKPATRTAYLNVRLTTQEKADLAALAQQQGVTCSLLARHLLQQAIGYHQQLQESRLDREK